MADEPRQIMHFNEDRLIFGLLSDDFAVHFWVRNVWDKERRHGGIESYTAGGTGERCWLLVKPCVHDGSSLQAEERFIPLFDDCNVTHDFAPLWGALRRTFNERKPEAEL